MPSKTEIDRAREWVDKLPATKEIDTILHILDEYDRPDITVEEIEKIIYQDLEEQCGLDEWDMPDTKRIAKDIKTLIDGRKCE